MRKMVSMLISVILIASLSVPVLAVSEEKYLENKLYQMQEYNLVVEDNSDVKIHVCTEDETVEYYVRYEGMTWEQAEEQVKQMRIDGYQQVDYVVENDFGMGRTAIAGAKVKCYASGSFFSFEEVLREWTTTGKGDGNFIEDYILTTISSDKQTLQIQARGTYETAVDNSLTGSVGLDLEVIGFEFSFSSGGKTYYRKNEEWGKIWSK